MAASDLDDIPAYGQSTLRPPPVVLATTDLNWPAISTGESFFDKALANGSLEGGIDPSYANGSAGAHGTGALDDWARDEAQEDVGADDEGWELEEDADVLSPSADVENDVEEEEDLGAGAVPGVEETEHWVRNSPLAVDHAAAGSFETAMQASVTKACHVSC